MSDSLKEDLAEILDPFFAGRFYGDRAPERETKPYAVADVPTTRTVVLRGDARAQAWRLMFLIDIWQSRMEEDPLLVERVIHALDGAVVWGGRRVAVESTVRVPDPDYNVVHDSMTCVVTRRRDSIS